MASEERKKELIRKAEEGNADAQYQLALKYENGDGVEKTCPPLFHGRVRHIGRDTLKAEICMPT